MYEIVFGREYKHVVESKNEKYLNEFFYELPGVDPITVPFKSPCPLFVDKVEFLGIPTDIWSLNGNKFSTISIYRTQLEDYEEREMVAEILDSRKKIVGVNKIRVVESESISKKMLCDMIPEEENKVPIGMMIISNYDPATNYRHFLDILSEITTTSWPILRKLLSDSDNPVVNRSILDVPIQKTATDIYPKIAVEPIATWVSDDLGKSPTIFPAENMRGEDFIIHVSRIDRLYLSGLIGRSNALMKRTKYPNKNQANENPFYVIEIEGYYTRDGMIYHKNKGEMKYMVVVGHNEGGDYEGTGMILRMNHFTSARYQLASVLGKIKKGISGLKGLDEFESWSENMFKKVEKASTKGTVNHSEPYEKVSVTKI
jgi:hypothetical protein